VRHSLRQNPLTVISIFVNPAQFAPHEDLATYPRTLNSDLEKLQKVVENVDMVSGSSTVRKPSAVFIPPVNVMYPSGITQDVEKQKGTFVQVKGYDQEMEGKSRPGFFRGVATVVTKLFNAVEVSSFRPSVELTLLTGPSSLSLLANTCVLWPKGYSASIATPAPDL
jgi:pantoate--beta-alanine ligase